MKKRVRVYNWNSVLTNVIEGLRKLGHDVEEQAASSFTGGWDKFDVIVVWSETEGTGWDELIEKANKKGIRTVLVQHGRRGSSKKFPPFFEPLKSDVICVWGENDKKRVMTGGVPEDKIEITGTTIFDFLKPREEHEGYNVVFSPEHWDHDVAENFIIKSTLDKLRNVKITTKLLEGEHTKNYYTNPVWSDRNMHDHLGVCADVLKTADLVVAVSESTFELLAEIMDIPVIIADIWVPKTCLGDKKYLTYVRETSDACTKVKDLKKLNKEIKKQLKHPGILREERKQIGIGDGGLDIKDPMERIIKVILGE